MMMKNELIAEEISSKKELWGAVRRAAPIQQIRRAMRQKHILNKDLAERLGVSEASISRLLKGTQNLQLDTLFMLADAVDEQLVIQVGVPEMSHADCDDFDDVVAANSSEEFQCEFENVYSLRSYARSHFAPKFAEPEIPFANFA